VRGGRGLGWTPLKLGTAKHKPKEWITHGTNKQFWQTKNADTKTPVEKTVKARRQARKAGKEILTPKKKKKGGKEGGVR